MRVCSSLAVLLVATIPILTGCGGNPAPTVAPEPGAQVRVTAPDVGINKQAGRLTAVRADTLIMDTLRVAVASVTKFEVHRGRKSNARKGALIGGGVRGAGGLGLSILWVAGGCEWAGSYGGCETGEAAAAIAGTTAITFGVGAGLGALIGAFIKSDRWEEVPLDRLRVSVVPQRGGRFGLGVSIAF